MAGRDVRRRIGDAIGAGVISSNALARVVAAFTDNQVSTDAARFRVARALEDRVNKLTPCGYVIQSLYAPAIEGDDIQIFGVHPVAFLLMLSMHIPAVVEMLRELALKYDGVWNTLVYEDGAETGALLRTDHHKAMCLYYYSYKELGAIRLSHSDWWMLLSEVRLSVVQKARGKNAGVFKALAEV